MAMARRSDHSRDELYALALEAARNIAESEGLSGLTARRIARKIGYSAGTLYNHFENLDDLIVQLNARTLDALYETCVSERQNGDPEDTLRALARAYIGFTADHSNLWNVVIEHRLPAGTEPPDWYRDKVRQLLGLVEEALAPFFAPGDDNRRLQSARILWSGLYGMCTLASAGALAKTESVTAMADSLVTNYVAGLRYGASHSTSSATPT